MSGQQHHGGYLGPRAVALPRLPAGPGPGVRARPTQPASPPIPHPNTRVREADGRLWLACHACGQRTAAIDAGATLGAVLTAHAGHHCQDTDQPGAAQRPRRGPGVAAPVAVVPPPVVFLPPPSHGGYPAGFGDGYEAARRGLR